MQPLDIRLIQFTFQPDAVGSRERKTLYPVRAGDRVLWASARKLTLAAAASDSSMKLGDGDDEDGYITADTEHVPSGESDPSAEVGDLDLESGIANDLVNGSGAYLQTMGGHLYLRDDAITVYYDPGLAAGATNPKVAFKIAIVKGEW